VRPHYLKRVCLVGPESTGKTILARRLAERFDTTFVPEFANGWIAMNGWPKGPVDLEEFVHGQMAMQHAAEELADKVLFCDSDPLTTRLWSEFLYGSATPMVKRAALDTDYDLYLVTSPNTPFVPDVHRKEGLVDREAFFMRTINSLKALQRHYVVIDENDWDSRIEQAVAAVESNIGVRAALSNQSAEDVPQIAP
jgi:NadR type nicotinamide-nucleotide adenylyltransferase